MSAPTSDPELQGGWGRTANDVFKSRSKRRLGWSLTAAAGLHGVLFAWSPSWQRASPPELPILGMGMEVVSLQGDMGSPAGGTNLPGAIVVGDPEDTPSTEDPEGEQGQHGLRDWDLVSAYQARGSEALRAELNRRAQPVPTLAEPEVEPDPSAGSSDGEGASEGGEEEGGTRIGGSYSLSDYEALTQDEMLALERLSALRPELAFISPSSWILIRNPSDLTEFLEERFRVPQEGAVSVAIWVDEQGSVEWAEIQRSSGRRDLDESALELFREIIAFRPARRGGVNVPMALVFSVPFPW